MFVDSKDRVYEATSFPSVLSMPLLLKELVPRLAAAADGDPATSTDEQSAAAPTRAEAASFPAKVDAQVRHHHGARAAASGSSSSV